MYLVEKRPCLRPIHYAIMIVSWRINEEAANDSPRSQLHKRTALMHHKDLIILLFVPSLTLLLLIWLFA